MVGKLASYMYYVSYNTELARQAKEHCELQTVKALNGWLYHVVTQTSPKILGIVLEFNSGISPAVHSTSQVQ